MSLSDPDLEMLESYLDGELSASEGDALIDRLRREPQLAEMLKGYMDAQPKGSRPRAEKTQTSSSAVAGEDE